MFRSRTKSAPISLFWIIYASFRRSFSLGWITSINFKAGLRVNCQKLNVNSLHRNTYSDRLIFIYEDTISGQGERKWASLYLYIILYFYLCGSRFELETQMTWDKLHNAGNHFLLKLFYCLGWHIHNMHKVLFHPHPPISRPENFINKSSINRYFRPPPPPV